MTDANGNNATQASTTVVKDTANPTVTITSSPAINNANKAAYIISGACSENALTVIDQAWGGVLRISNLYALGLDQTVNVTAVSIMPPWPVTADHTDVNGNNAPQAATTVLKDTSNPTVTITSSPTINNANKAAYTISGACSENTRTVNIDVGRRRHFSYCLCRSRLGTDDFRCLSAASDHATFLISS